MSCSICICIHAFIKGFVYNCLPIKAMEFYMLMLKDEVCPSSYTFSSMIKACTLVPSLGFGGLVHCQVTKNGFASHLFVQTGLIDFYSNLDRIAHTNV